MKRASLILALFCLTALLGLGVPLLLRTPVWVDVTYHDLSAWNVMHGGVHYRDVFETNLPGMVWAHCLIRPIVGWSHEAIRIVDLLVVGSVVGILILLLKRVGLSASARAWFAVAAALFYLFETEFIHCQRDGWMLLPAVAATALRVRRVAKPQTMWWSILEGVLWGCAVWIKPHVLLPAAFAWGMSLRFQPRRAAMIDLGGLLGGGVLAGVAGTIWLVETGTWPHMWDVLLNWNQEYYKWSWGDLWKKMRIVSIYFVPFSLLHFVALPVGVIALFRREPTRAIGAALYLGWMAQATFIQKVFDYAHAPPTLLGIWVLAAHRWPVGPVFLAWCVSAGLINEFAANSDLYQRVEQAKPLTTHAAIPHHPIARSERLELWPRCFLDNSWELKDRLSYYPYIHCAPHWADLQHVADFLRRQGVKHGDLICWHDSTHPLYVWLNIRPGIRFPHVITAMKFRSKLDTIRKETFGSHARFVVSDLVPITYTTKFLEPEPPPGPADRLPPEFPAWGNDVYPWNQQVVYRAGRYFVHRIDNPRGDIEFPLPEGLKD